MKATKLPKHDAAMEPELRELCDHLNARDRVKAAKKFQRWVDQLTKSAIIMEPGLVPLIPPPKVPRGFFLVNLASYRRKEMQALARSQGVTVPMMMQWAMSSIENEMKERARVAEMSGQPFIFLYKIVNSGQHGLN